MEVLLRNRTFRLLWFGTLSVRLGSQIAVLAITWLVLRSTGSGTKIGIVLSLYAVGDMLASPFVGVLLDRVSRKLLLNLDNLLQAGIFGILTLLYASHHLAFSVLLGLVVLSGALTPVAYLGRMIILPNVVHEDEWEAANTLLQANMNLVTLLGPALGGVLVSILGVSDTLLITAGLYLVYFAALAFIPRSRFQAQESHRSTNTVLSDVLLGWKFLRQVPLLAVLVVVTLLFSLTYGPLEPALPVMVHTIFHRGAKSLGLLWSAFAVGALGGTLLWGHLRLTWGLRGLVAGIIVLWGVFSGGLGLTHGVVAAAILLALGGFTYAPYTIVFSLWRQRLVPDHLRGRVFGAINSIIGVGLPLGQAAGGLLIGAVGVRGTLVIGGLACILLGVGAFARRAVWETPAQDVAS